MRLNEWITTCCLVVSVNGLKAQGEVLRALSARPEQMVQRALNKSVLNEHFIYLNEPQVLPLMDDFSIVRIQF